MFLVVGLGNPGSSYVATRHNVGFLVADQLARRAMTTINTKGQGALTGKARLADQAIVLAKPVEYMNRSGSPVQKLVSFYKLDLDHVVVVHDDMDIDFGRVRIKVGGGHGGHNGLRDLNKHLGSDYVRVRVGVSRPPAGWDPANYVLGRWTDAESQQLEDIVGHAADAAESLLREGASSAMNRFNVRLGDAASASSSL